MAKAMIAGFRRDCAIGRLQEGVYISARAILTPWAESPHTLIHLLGGPDRIYHRGFEQIVQRTRRVAGNRPELFLRLPLHLRIAFFDHRLVADAGLLADFDIARSALAVLRSEALHV